MKSSLDGDGVEYALLLRDLGQIYAAQENLPPNGGTDARRDLIRALRDKAERTQRPIRDLLAATADLNEPVTLWLINAMALEVGARSRRTGCARARRSDRAPRARSRARAPLRRRRSGVRRPDTRCRSRPRRCTRTEGSGLPALGPGAEQEARPRHRRHSLRAEGSRACAEIAPQVVAMHGPRGDCFTFVAVEDLAQSAQTSRQPGTDHAIGKTARSVLVLGTLAFAAVATASFEVAPVAHARRDPRAKAACRPLPLYAVERSTHRRRADPPGRSDCVFRQRPVPRDASTPTARAPFGLAASSAAR